MNIKFLLVALIGSGLFTALYGYTMPIAQGNHWVYRYYDSTHDTGGYDVVSGAAVPRPEYDSVTTGSLDIEIDSFVNRNDSVFYSILTTDSGRIIAGEFGVQGPVNSDTTGYHYHHSRRYCTIKDSNYILDSLGQWNKTGWQVDSSRMGLPGKTGTVWHLTASQVDPLKNPSGWDFDAIPWFLNYPGPTNSPYCVIFENNVASYTTKRHSDSLYPALLNGNSFWCYSTHILDSFMSRGLPTPISNSNCFWIRDIGYGFYTDTFKTMMSVNIYGGPALKNVFATWSLLSFNGFTIALPSNVIKTTHQLTAQSNVSNPYRKMFLLEGINQPFNSSVGIFNIRGQRMKRIQRAQILICKNR